MTRHRPDSDELLVARGLLLLEAELVARATLKPPETELELKLIEAERKSVRRLYRRLRKSLKN